MTAPAASAPRRALVTGAARRLGRLLALDLAAHGVAVVLHANRSIREAEELAAAIAARGGRAAVVQADFAAEAFDPASLVAAASAAIGGPLDLLVNNASGFEYDSPAEVSPEIFTRLMRTNLLVPLRLAEAFHRAADPAADNVVVNLLDQKLWNLNPDFFSYTLGKAGLHAATTMMAQAFRPSTRVCAIAPGLLFPSFGLSEAEHAAVASRNLLRRPIDPQEVAAALRFILDTPSFTGQVLHVDNGQRFVAGDRDVIFEDGDADA